MKQRRASLMVVLGTAGALLLSACGGNPNEDAVRESCIDGFRDYALQAGIESSDGLARVAVQLAEPEEWSEVCWVTIRATAACTFFERRRTQQTADGEFSCAVGSPTTAQWTEFSLDAATP